MSYIGTEANQDIVVNSHEYTATAGQTTFNAIYDDLVEVYLNGTLLSNNKYTAIDGQSVILSQGATAGDVVKIYGYQSFKADNKVDLGNINQTIDGIKTFVNSPKIPDATNTDEPLAKGQFLGGLGLTGEVWVDETVNRVSGTVYTNTYGKPIEVAVNIGTDGLNGTFRVELSVDGKKVSCGSDDSTSYSPKASARALVPSGSTYSVDSVTLSGTINGWYELK